MIYTFIRNNEKIFPIKKMCKVVQVGQRSYYQWKSGAISDRKQKNVLVKEKIISIYFDSKQRYGSPRMTAELTSLGNKLSRITVAKYMNQLGLQSKLSKKFKVTANSKQKYLIVPVRAELHSVPILISKCKDYSKFFDYQWKMKCCTKNETSLHKNSIQSDHYSINNKIQTKQKKLSPFFTKN
jgi:hypothetical protein